MPRRKTKKNKKRFINIPKWGRFSRFGKFSIKYVFENLFKFKIKNKKKYSVFKKCINCMKCNLEGKFFALEKRIGRNITSAYSFNLYGLDKKNSEVMMTIDHIIPKARGGSNDINNLQTMCYYCNQKKGCKL